MINAILDCYSSTKSKMVMDLDKGRRMEGYDLYRIFVCEMRKIYRSGIRNVCLGCAVKKVYFLVACFINLLPRWHQFC